MQRLESDPGIGLFLAAHPFNPNRSFAARFWYVRGFEHAGNQTYGKGKVPRGRVRNRAGLFGIAPMRREFCRLISPARRRENCTPMIQAQDVFR